METISIPINFQMITVDSKQRKEQVRHTPKEIAFLVNSPNPLNSPHVYNKRSNLSEPYDCFSSLGEV